MQFSNLALSGWSYEKGDKEIPVEEAGIPDRIIKRNPAKSTYVYSDPSDWRERLQHHSKKAAEMAGITEDNIQAFFGVHNGYKKHPEGASPVSMLAFPNSQAFQLDYSLGCASVIMGAQLAGLHFSHPGTEMQNIIMGAVQMTTQYTSDMTDGNALFADSIGTLAFSKKSDGNQIKFTQINSNANFYDMFQLDDDGFYQIHNLHKGRDLTEFMIKAFSEQYRNSCMALKTMPKNLDYVVMSCSTHSATKRVLEAMQIPLERTGLECMEKIPHMGTNDLIYQIEHGIEQGMIKKGSKILITGTSLGFSIATMAVEWGS